MSRGNIAIFVPHVGCPHKCAFCDQRTITGQVTVPHAEDVRAARTQCDVLLVYFHKGYVHRPVTVAAWERLLSHIAIDNGADAVMGSHSHIAHGVGVYKGKAIYHGLTHAAGFYRQTFI